MTVIFAFRVLSSFQSFPVMQDPTSQTNDTPSGDNSKNPFQLDLNSIRSRKKTPGRGFSPQIEDKAPPVSHPDVDSPQENHAIRQAKNTETKEIVPLKERSQQRETAVSSKTGNSDKSLDEITASPITFRLLMICAVLGATLVIAYWYTLVDLVKTWNEVTDYHHGFFVIPLVIYFLWNRRGTIPRNISTTDRVAGVVLGFTLLGLCVLCRHQFMIYSMVSLDAWTILLWIFGVTLIFFGFRTFLWAAPSLLFLAFMFAWPDSIEIMFRRHLQGIAASMSATILWLIGEHAISINNTIWLDSIQLDVAAVCSGIRILVSVIAAAYAVSLLMKRPWWQNTLMFCLAIPVALVINAFRIVTTGLLIKYASGMVESFGFNKPVAVVCDEIAGNIMLVLAFFTFILIVYYIGKVFERVVPEGNES